MSPTKVAAVICQALSPGLNHFGYDDHVGAAARMECSMWRVPPWMSSAASARQGGFAGRAAQYS